MRKKLLKLDRYSRRHSNTIKLIRDRISDNDHKNDILHVNIKFIIEEHNYKTILKLAPLKLMNISDDGLVLRSAIHWIFECGRRLFVNWILSRIPFSHHAFFFEFGKFSSVSHRRDEFPHQ